MNFGALISVSIETRLEAGWPAFNSRQGQWWDIFSLGQLSFLSHGQWVSYPGGNGAWAWSWSLTSI